MISNEALANNQSLQLAAKKGLLFINNLESLKIFEGFVNNPDIQNNKYISDALWPIAELLSYADRSFISNVIQKFRTGDMSVVSDILENEGNLKNYYFGIPLSFANKQIEDLSQQERDILRNWIYTQRDKPLSSNLLSGVYPAVPTTSEEFINTVLKLNEIEHINTTALEPAKITEFKNNLLNLASGKAEHDDVAKITSLMPEIFNDGKEISGETLRQLRQISASQNFNLLSEKDKIIVIMSVILKDTDDNLLNLSRKTVDIAQRFGFSKYDSEKIANVICCSNLISDFMKTTKNTVKYELNNNQKIITNNRREFFDNAAFLLKDGNTFELAKMVYSLHERDGLTRYLDKMLANKIKEYKSHDFMMPQTPKSSYHAKARSVEVNKNGKIYHVRDVNRSEIENFCGYLHTPENVSSRKDASLMQNIAKFMLAGNGNLSERIVCACYVDATSKSFVNNSYNYGLGSGLILKVSNNKQYVGAGSDISSLEKNRKELIQSYYNENDLINTGMNVPDGTKMHKLRTLISDNLKKILGVDDNEYVQRIDNIKEELGDEVLSMERLREIDPEMADAYKEFLSARILDKNDFNNAVLRDDYEWNEFLISEAKINDFYTTHLDKMPEEYLEIASNPDNDIVIVLMYD